MPPKRRAAAARTTASKARSSRAKAAPQRRTTTTAKEGVKQVKTKQPPPVTRKRPRSDSQHVKPKQRTRRSSKQEDTSKSPVVAALRDTRSEDSPAQLTASRETRQSIHAWQHSLSESAPHTAACTQSVKENMSEAVDVAKQLFASHSPTRVNEEENSKSSSSETVFIAEKQSSEGAAEAVVQHGNAHHNTSYTEESNGGDIELVLHSLTSSSSSSSLDTAELFSLSSVEPNSRRTTVRHTQNEEEEEHNNENRSGNTTNMMMTSCMTARSSATQAALSAPSPSLSTQPLHEGGHEIHTPLNTAANAALQMNQDLLRAHFLQSSPGHLRLDGSGRKENTILLEQQEIAQQRCFPSQPPSSLQTHTTAAAHVRHSSLQSNPNTAESGTSHATDGAQLGHTLPSRDSASRPSTQLITRAAAMRPLVSPGTMWICLDDDDEDATEPTSPSSPTLRNVLLTPATQQQQQQKSTPMSSTSSGAVFAKAYSSIQTVNRTIQNGEKYATQPVRPFFQPQALQSMGRLSTEQGRSVSQEVRQSKEPIGTMLWPTFRPRRAIPPSLVATQGDRARNILTVHAASKLRLPEHGYIRMDDDDDDEDHVSKKGVQGSKTATPQLLPFIKDDDHTESSRTSVTTNSEEEEEERTASPRSSGTRTTTTTSTSSSSFTASGSTSSTTMKTRSQTSSAAPLSSPNRSVIDFLFSARPTHIAHSEGDHETSERDKQAGRRTVKQTKNRDSVHSSKKDRLGWGRPVDDLLRLFPQRYTKASFRAAAADVIPAAHFLGANEFWSAFASATYVGEGSFGLVWRCVTVAGDAVAVKSCPVTLRSRGSIEDGFATVREIATMRFLSEQQVPYVLPLHSAFYVTGQEALPPQIVRVLEWRRAQRAAAEAAVVARRVTALSRGGRSSARSKRTAAVAKTAKSKQSEEDEKDFESAVQAELRRMEANESAQERAVRAEMQAVALPRFFSIREDEVRDCEVTIFLVTELCDGDVESIPRNDAVTKGVAYCVSSALAAMHELGLLHLDLKPSNILFAYERTPTQGHTNTNATTTTSNGNEWGSRYDSPPLDITTLTSVTPPTERTPPTARLSSAEPVILAERVEVTSSAAAQCVGSDVSMMKAGAAEGGGAAVTSNGINVMKETMPSAAVCKDEQSYHVDQLSPCRDVNEEMGKRASGHGLTTTSRTDVRTASLTPSQPRSQRETTASIGQPSAPPAIKFYLSDFGNCRVVGPAMSDIVKDVYGTFEYMDLRALRDEVCSRATDSFSLGCTLYEMLYGRRVYPHCTNPKCLNEEDHTRLCFVEAAKRPVVMPVSLSNTITQSEHHTQACEMKSEAAVGKIPLTTLQKVTAALLLHDPQQRMTAAQCHAHLAKAYHVTQALRHPSTT